MSCDPTAATTIQVSGLSKVYQIYDRPENRLKQSLFGRWRRYYREFWALRGVDLTIRRGETIGIIGRNGSGKSTLLQIICGTLQPSAGTIAVDGRISALLELGSGFNPDFTGRENVYLNSAILGLSRAETDAIYQEIVDFAGIGEHIDQPTKTYSSGMVVRLAFAVAIMVKPDILVVDEALAVGDEAFQRRCLARIAAIRESGATILFVSHSANQIVDICDRAVLLDGGEVMYDGAPRRAINLYHRLLYSAPDKRAAFRSALAEAFKSGGLLPDEREDGVEGMGGEGTAATAAAQDQDQVEDYENPGLVARSSTIYEPRGARLSDLHITSLDGRRVNMLIAGRRYIIRVRLDVTEDAWSLAVGTQIKTVTGVIMGGASTASTPRMIDHVTAGSVFDIAHEFECRALDGTYFVNAGVSALVGGERLWLHRLVDAGVFAVVPGPRLYSNGPFDFAFDSSLTPVTRERMSA